MYAEFKLTPHGWICRKVWNVDLGFLPVSLEKTIFMPVSKRPKHGFCRRPHYYA
jgi:hypothetical protein